MHRLGLFPSTHGFQAVHDRPSNPKLPDSTATLLEPARAGDRAAIEALFDRCLPALRRWARGRLPQWARDVADTQDVVQEALVQTFKNMETFQARGEGALQAYCDRRS